MEEQKKETPANQPTDEESLESLESVGESAQVKTEESKDPAASDSKDKSPDGKSGKPAGKKASKNAGSPIKRLTARFNIYFAIFIIILVAASAFTMFFYFSAKNSKSTNPTQELSEDALKQLKTTDTSVGDPKQTLTVASNAVFSGQVLVRNNLDVAGAVKIGGSLNLSGLIVSGDSTLDQIQGNKLNITGDTTLQGQLSIQKGLVVTGGASFGAAISAPTISVQALQLTGDLQFSRHIDAGGPTPGHTNGTAMGSGGTVSVSGTDTAGTIAINTGGSPPAGCFVTVKFSRAFSVVPHVVVTPIGPSASGLNYFVNRSSTEFSLCTSNPSPAGANFSFDYIVID